MTEHSPAVTVIIPTFNSSGTLKLALASVLRQDISNYEVWVVGDGCTDDSESVVSCFHDDRLHWTNLPANSGSPAAPRNEGLRHARGKYIAYLGHDDLWFPWHLSQLLECLARGRSDFAYSLGVLLGPQGVFNSFSLPKQAWSFEYLSPSNWLHRRDLPDSIGPWSTKLRLGDDRDFLDRFFASGKHPSFLKQLSVIKYPSSQWRMYSLSSDFPQEKELHAMIENAEALRLSLLLDLAACQSTRVIHTISGRTPFGRTLRAIARQAVNAYGCNRWPMNLILQRRRRRNSGLDEKQKKLPVRQPSD